MSTEYTTEYTIFDNCEEASTCHSFLQRYDPRYNPEEFWMLIAMCSMSIGMVLLFFGFVIPRDYYFDADLPAREMEAIEIYYSNLSFNLDICIVVGMGFIALGGTLVSTVITCSVIKETSGEDMKNDQQSDMGLINRDGIEMTLYGSTTNE